MLVFQLVFNRYPEGEYSSNSEFPPVIFNRSPLLISKLVSLFHRVTRIDPVSSIISIDLTDPALPLERSKVMVSCILVTIPITVTSFTS